MGVFFPHGAPAPQPLAASDTGQTITIGCRIINGLTVNVHYADFQRQIKLNGPSGHGDVAFDNQGRPTRQGNMDNHSFNSSQPTRGAYGTTVIQRNEWEAIQRSHRDADWLQRGMVFAL
jgi:hypothetical protein